MTILQKLHKLLSNSQSFELIKSAGFCFCIETKRFICCDTNGTIDYYLVAIAQCTGYRPIAGEFYPATEFELEEMNQQGIEVSAMHCLDNFRYRDYHHFVEKIKDIAAVTAQMIAECPRFYAIKAEYEGDLIAASLPQQPAQPTTNTQRGRL